MVRETVPGTCSAWVLGWTAHDPFTGGVSCLILSEAVMYYSYHTGRARGHGHGHSSGPRAVQSQRAARGHARARARAVETSRWLAQRCRLRQLVGVRRRARLGDAVAPFARAPFVRAPQLHHFTPGALYCVRFLHKAAATEERLRREMPDVCPHDAPPRGWILVRERCVCGGRLWGATRRPL